MKDKKLIDTARIVYNEWFKEEVRNPLTYDRHAVSDANGLSCPEPTLTQQQFAEESDINFIAKRFGLTGEMPQVLELPKYGDFSGIFDFQTAQDSVIEAQRQFMTLPARVRAQFNNNPQQLLQFLDSTNPDDRELAQALGLVKKPSQEPLQSRLDDAAGPDGANPAQGAGKPATDVLPKDKKDKKDT